jgi:hypothetical protein
MRKRVSDRLRERVLSKGEEEEEVEEKEKEKSFWKFRPVMINYTDQRAFVVQSSKNEFVVRSS